MGIIGKVLKKVLAAALIFVFIMGVVPAQNVHAEAETVWYLDGTGALQSRNDVNILDPSIKAPLEGSNVYYVLKGVEDDVSMLTIAGDIHLILENNCDWSISNGIRILEDSRLTIYAEPVDADMETGKLTVTGGTGSAGIGGGAGSGGGTIVINGGNITAIGGAGGAGIGGGAGGAGIGGGAGSSGGTIVINGGNITAIGGAGGAGIGGGAGGNGGSISIGGNATIMTSGAGDGAGDGGSGAGIGGGLHGDGGEILINGNTIITANGGYGAGNNPGGGCNGAGVGGGGYASGGTITISGNARVIANGGYYCGAGIGGGINADGGDIHLNGGEITAYGGAGGAGIGGGGAADDTSAFAGNVSGGKITIDGDAIVTAFGYYGAGIGGGNGGAGGIINIGGNAKVIASGDSIGNSVGDREDVEGSGAGIGGGGKGIGGAINISENAFITASGGSNGGAGIGGGGYAAGGEITISGGNSIITTGGNSGGAGIGGGKNGGAGGKITISGDTIITSTGGTIGGAGIGGGKGGGGGVTTIGDINNITATGGDYGGADIGGGRYIESGILETDLNPRPGVPRICDSGTITVAGTRRYVVSFDPNSGSVTPGSALTQANGTLSSLPMPTSRNNTFSYWSTALTRGTQVTINTVYNEHTSIYAQWTVPRNNSTSDGGSSNIQPRNVTPITIEEMSPPLFGRENNLAAELYKLGLFRGTGIDENGNPIFDLDSPLTRLQSLVLIVRLLGQENNALAYTGSNPFTDVPMWGVPYVAFGFAEGITNGTSQTAFSPNQYVTCQQFTAFLLRALGYSENNGDFTYADTSAFSMNVGLFDKATLEVLSDSAFLRSESVVAIVNALSTTVKGSKDIRLIDTLVSSKFISEEAMMAFLSVINT